MRIVRFFAVGGAIIVFSAGAAIPAAAAPTDTTTVTFEILAGTLDIDGRATAYLGTGVPGGTLSGSIAPVAVTDSRAAIDATWEATVTSTAFQTGGGTTPETVTPEAIDYWSGSAMPATGDGTFTPGQLTPTEAEPLSSVTPLIAFTHTGGAGNNTATWGPVLIVNFPPGSVAGVYTGTVTHSVA